MRMRSEYIYEYTRVIILYVHARKVLVPIIRRPVDNLKNLGLYTFSHGGEGRRGADGEAATGD